MRRSLVSLPVAALLAASLQMPAAAEGPRPPSTRDGLRAYSITPPGQDGTVTTAELSSGDYGPHYSDQLEKYASLVEDRDVTESELPRYFHSMRFGPGRIGSYDQPAEGVDVFRDSFGVPHIYASSFSKAGFGLGYVTAEDRLFEMDVFRHAARGTLAEFIGPGDNDVYLKMDVDTRREGYTQREVERMLDLLDDKFGRAGRKIQRGLQAYADGVNAYLEHLRTAPLQQPVEYAPTANPPPEEWTPEDTAYIAILQLRVFGETAGTELSNAALYKHLRERLGRKAGKKLYDDLLFQNDPRSPTTIARSDGDFWTQRLGPVDRRSFAVPDDAVQVAQRVQARESDRWAVLESLGFKRQTSNALLVAARESATGNPLLLGGPQVGHAVPSFFLDVDVHAPGVDFRGPAVPGASALVPLGRGRDYAWTLTTGYSDAVDTRVDLLCEPGGGDPTMGSNGYMFKGRCRRMSSREETFVAKPTATDPGAPRVETKTFYRTKHGPVFERGTVGGKPVAFVKQRFFWKKEIDSLPSFYRWNARVDSIKDFASAARGFTMSFNSFYADHRNIAYFHVGMYPVRTRGVHPSLPTWGTGKWEWHGRRSYSLQPKIVNPEQGWLSNWNNKPARHWDNQDNFKWGVIHRMKLLSQHMAKLLRGDRKARLSSLADVVRRAATRDARGVYLGPLMVRKAARASGVPGKTPKYGRALRIVRAWIDAGAHRRNQNRDATMDRGRALAIFDAWYYTLVRRIFDDELGPRGYRLMAADAPKTNYNPENGGGFFFDFSSYVKNLFQRERFSSDLCDDRRTRGKETCGYQTRVALVKALARLEKRQGRDMSRWEKRAENITFDALGAGGVEDIPWQNRGTENHLVEVLRDVSG